MLPPGMVNHPYFGLDNCEHWVTNAAFCAFLHARTRKPSCSVSVQRTPQRYCHTLPLSVLDVYERSPCRSMSRSVTPVPYPTPLQSAPSRSRTMPLPVEVIEILDSDNEDCSIPAQPMQLKRKHEPSPEIPGNVSQCTKSHPSKRKKAEDTVKITKRSLWMKSRYWTACRPLGRSLAHQQRTLWTSVLCLFPNSVTVMSTHWMLSFVQRYVGSCMNHSLPT
jgi:hypothetical protein